MGVSRDRLLTFLLVPAVMAAVLVLAGVMFRSSFQLEKLRERSVVEATLLLANEKADRLDKRIIEQDNAVASLVDPTRQESFAREWLNVAAIQTPSVRAVRPTAIAFPRVVRAPRSTIRRRAGPLHAAAMRSASLAARPRRAQPEKRTTSSAPASAAALATRAAHTGCSSRSPPTSE